MTRRFAPTPVQADLSQLDAGDRRALVKLIQAAQEVNLLYMEQLWSGNLAEYEKWNADKSALGRARVHYYWMNKGPWSDLDGHVAFVPGVPAHRPPGANFYPADMSKDEFETWAAKLPKDQEEAARGFFTVIRRDAQGKLKAIPYSVEYRGRLETISRLLRDAAKETSNASLKRFLEARAAAGTSNDYYESDMAWMDLDAPLDITIGPYETYTDDLFGYKAAFEAYVNLRDDAETHKLKFFADHLQDVENHLPIDPKYRNPKLGAQAPLRVVNEIYCAGDGDHGVQTAAYNLPNDERVVQQKGSKRVMLKNVQEAKFKTTLEPIAARVMPADTRSLLSFDMFFTHILAHELSHGIGPHQITVQGRQTTPRQEMKDLYSAIEEAKADVTGLFLLQHLIDTGRWGGSGAAARETERKLYATFFASAFRTLRFGLTEAHGKGMALQFNYLVEKGAYRELPGGGYALDWSRMKGAVRDLAHDLLTLEAEATYAGTKAMMNRYVKISPHLQKALDGLKDLPTDIEPKFVTAEALLKR